MRCARARKSSPFPGFPPPSQLDQVAQNVVGYVIYFKHLGKAVEEGLASAGTFAPMRSATITPKWTRATSSSSVRASRAFSVTDARARPGSGAHRRWRRGLRTISGRWKRCSAYCHFHPPTLDRETTQYLVLAIRRKAGHLGIVRPHRGGPMQDAGYGDFGEFTFHALR